MGRPTDTDVIQLVNRTHAVALVAQRLGAGAVAGGEAVLAADAAEHPQAGHDVAGAGSEFALLVAVDGLGAAQPVQQRGQAADEHGDTEQHDDREHGKS